MKSEPIITTDLSTEELLRLALERFIEHEATMRKQISEIHEMLREAQRRDRAVYDTHMRRVA